MATTAGRLKAPRALDALRHRDFRYLFTGQTISLIGDAAFLTALGWKTFTLAGTSKLGVVLVCQAIGVLTTLLIGGALADRLSRRRLMIVSDLTRLVAVAALAAVDASGHLTLRAARRLRDASSASGTGSSTRRSAGWSRSSSSSRASRRRTR